MQAAKEQARRYARALPEGDGWPPFLVVVDVGYCIDLYADFARQGKTYVQFPDPQRYRIHLEDLADPEVRERLRLLWTDPLALDPARRSARVTRDLAEKLGRLAASLEADGHAPDATAQFLMRGLFTMFAEDVGLLPERSFTGLLEDYADSLDVLPDALEDLWQTMDAGGFSGALRAKVPQFNGALFAEADALPISEAQRELLLRAARADWSDVEPAIFGTLLERALDPRERHRLGAHYTPRAYVERLEAEVLQALEGYGVSAGLDMTGGNRVSPEQLLGMEINPRAARIADVVLWIGYLQWHFRTYGSADRLDAPILKRYDNIQQRDALITYAEKTPRTDDDGQPVTRWDRRTYKAHPTTGEQVPDEAAQEPVFDYADPQMAEWPQAEFIVGNPPFIGAKDLREALGDGYTEALRDAYFRRVPQSADFVMFWWYKAALAVRGALDEYDAAAERFGFITTNSIRQTFNRRVMEKQMGYKNAAVLAFAIPDHPWVTAKEGADVRIAMTVGTAQDGAVGTLQTVVREDETGGLHRTVELADRRGTILPDLTIGPDVAGAEALEANADLVSAGVKLHGSGFIVEPDEAEALGLGEIEGLENHIRPYRNGRDLAQTARGVMVIDLYGLEKEDVRDRFPAVYQHVKENVKPERDQNNRKAYRENWWIFGEARETLRNALDGLDRYIATWEVAKHRIFQFLDASILPDNKLIAFALDDAFHLGVLQSRIHVAWALAAGGNLGVGNDPVYVKTRCFDPFPFPAATAEQENAIRQIAERLDAHRAARLEKHPDLTMTGCYNVLDKERRGEPLDEAERAIHERGLVGVLRELHDELDAAVAAAYGWPTELDEEEILYRLVALNKKRRAEEEQGHVRYLRPSYQAPEETQGALAMETAVAVGEDGAAVEPQPWPSALPERAQAVRRVVEAAAAPLGVEAVASRFHRAQRKDVRGLLETLAALGHVQAVEGGFAA